MLPIKPEPYQLMSLRFPQAVSILWDATTMADAENRPGNRRDHVFDTEDGLRLIISREKHPDEGNLIHMSMSFWDAARAKFEYKIRSEEDGFAVGLKAFKRVAGLEKSNIGYAICNFQGPHKIVNLFFPLDLTLMERRARGLTVPTIIDGGTRREAQ